MAYELYLVALEGTDGIPTSQIIGALEAVGVVATEQVDAMGHWLVLKGCESALNLMVTDGVATGGNFRFVTQDDQSLVDKVVEAFKAVGWQVFDDEGEL